MHLIIKVTSSLSVYNIVTYMTLMHTWIEPVAPITVCNCDGVTLKGKKGKGTYSC